MHGFAQNAQCWNGFADELAAGRTVIAVGAPGHGRSAHDQADLVQAGELIVGAIGAADYVGYSMGGRMLLHAALADPDSIRSLVLIGTTGGIDDPDARDQRRTSDERLARDLLTRGVAAFVDDWLAGPLFAHLTPAQACRDERLANRAEGLASSLRNCGTGSQLPLWSRLGKLEMPVLVIAGSDDPKFTDLGRRLVDAIGANASFGAVEGGHAVHLENPTGTASLVRNWWPH